MSADHDPIEAGRLHAVGLAALAALLADERASDVEEALRIDPARAEAIALLGADPGELVASAWERRSGLGNALRSGLGQIARAAEGRGAWDDQSDDVLVAQGRASSNLARLFATIVSEHPRLGARLGDGGAILDIGTGTGALAFALAETFPAARVLGIDIAQRPLALAAVGLEDRPQLDGRVTLRRADVVELDDDAVFDVVWLPSPFLSPQALDQAIPVCRRALADGGRIVVGLNGSPDGSGQAAARRWLSQVSGVSNVSPDECRRALADVGFADFTVRPTVPGGPVLLDAGLATRP